MMVKKNISQKKTRLPERKKGQKKSSEGQQQQINLDSSKTSTQRQTRLPAKKKQTKKKLSSQEQEQEKQKQLQRKTTGTQQQQQININIGPTRNARVRQPIKEPVKEPVRRSIPTPQYIPMNIIQQPPTYFTPPVAAPSIATATTGTPVAPIAPIAPISRAPISSIDRSSSPISLTPPGSNISAIVSNPPSIVQRLGQNIGDYIGDWLVNATIPSTSTLPIQQPKQTRPLQPTIRPISDVNAPSVELNTFENFTPRQDIISNFIAFRDLDEPRAYSFNDYTTRFSNVNDWVKKAVDSETQTYQPTSSTETQTYQPTFNYGETQTYQPTYSEMGTQFDGFLPQQTDLPSGFSKAVSAPSYIPLPPPLPPTRPIAQPPPIPKEFIAPSQDIQKSAIQQITEENLQKLRGIGSNRNYAPSEISDITDLESINTDISNIMEQIRQRAGLKKNDAELVEERVNKIREEKKKEIEDKGMGGQMFREIEKRRQYIKEPEKQEDDDSEWIDLPIEPKPKKIIRSESKPKPESKPEPEIRFESEPKEIDIPIEIEPESEPEPEPKPKLKPVINLEFEPESKPEPEKKKKIERKKGSGRPTGRGNKSEYEKQLEDDRKEITKEIKDYGKIIKNLIKNNLEEDEKGISITDYEQFISDLEENLYLIDELIQGEIDKRTAPMNTIDEGVGEDEDEESAFPVYNFIKK